MANVVKFDIEIPADEKDTVNLVKNLLNKLGIKVREVEKTEINLLDEKHIISSHNEFFSKYVGIFDNKGFLSDNDIKEARLKRFSK